MNSEEYYSCLFCNCNSETSTLYDINGNSVLIGPHLIDFEDVIFEIFLRRVITKISNIISNF